MLNKIETWQAASPLLTLRKKKKLSRDSLAAAVGVTYRTIRLWETGLSRPTLNHMHGLCSVLGRGLRKKYEAWMDQRPYAGRAKTARK